MCFIILQGILVRDKGLKLFAVSRSHLYVSVEYWQISIVLVAYLCPRSFCRLVLDILQYPLCQSVFWIPSGPGDFSFGNSLIRVATFSIVTSMESGTSVWTLDKSPAIYLSWNWFWNKKLSSSEHCTESPVNTSCFSFSTTHPCFFVLICFEQFKERLRVFSLQLLVYSVCIKGFAYHFQILLATPP